MEPNKQIKARVAGDRTMPRSYTNLIYHEPKKHTMAWQSFEDEFVDLLKVHEIEFDRRYFVDVIAVTRYAG